MLKRTDAAVGHRNVAYGANGPETGALSGSSHSSHSRGSHSGGRLLSDLLAVVQEAVPGVVCRVTKSRWPVVLKIE